MFYILYGQDNFSLHQALKEIKSSLGDPEILEVNTSNLDGHHLTLRELKDKCSTVPFLSSCRLVIVNGLLKRFEPKMEKHRAGKRSTARVNGELGEWRELVSYIGQISPTTTLILIDDKVTSHNPLLRQLSPLAKVMTFPQLRGRSLRNWIERKIAEEGGNITSEAVSLLAEFIGGDLWMMNNEISKLLLYAQQRPIVADDVREMVGYAQEASVFALVDAILQGQAKIAQRTLYRLHREGASPTRILAMITRQFRLIAQVKELSSQLSHQQIQDKLGLTSSYSLDKTLAQAKLYDLEGIKRAYHKLLEADLGIKSGKYDAQLALEFLVAELTSF